MGVIICMMRLMMRIFFTLILGSLLFVVIKGHRDVIIMISSRVSMISLRRLKCGTLYALSRQKNPILRKVRRSWVLIEFYFSVNAGRNRDLLSSHDRVPWQPVRNQPSRLGRNPGTWLDLRKKRLYIDISNSGTTVTRSLLGRAVMKRWRVTCQPSI